MAALRELEGFPPGVMPSHGSATIGEAARCTVERRVAEFGRPPPEMSSADGKGGSRSLLRELLGVHAGYSSDEHQTIVPLDPSLLALPETGSPRVSPFDNAELSNSPQISEFMKSFVLPTLEGQRHLEESGFRRPYLDPSLRGGGRVYARFVHKLVRHGVVELTHQPGICECGAFTVRKKDGAQRLVIDARPAIFSLRSRQPHVSPEGHRWRASLASPRKGSSEEPSMSRVFLSFKFATGVETIFPFAFASGRKFASFRTRQGSAERFRSLSPSSGDSHGLEPCSGYCPQCLC